MTAREGVLLRGSGAERATPYREQSRIQRAPVQDEQATERRTTIRRAADLPVSTGGGTSFRLGDVYAEELGRLRQHARSEEHTSELQSPCNLVCRLLLKKKNRTRPGRRRKGAVRARRHRRGESRGVRAGY